MAVKEATEVLEEAMDVVDDTVDILEDRVSWLLNNHRNQLLLTSTACIAVGLAVGHLVAVKRLKARYQRFADEQIDSVKEMYTIPRIMPDANKPSLDELVRPKDPDSVAAQEVAEEITRDSGYVAYDKIAYDKISTSTASQVEDEIVVVRKNVFDSPDPDRYFNIEEEEQRRLTRPQDPYVITETEFNDGEHEYVQAELTYFDGDDVLVDDKDAPVESEVTVSDENLLRFGHGADDQNVVYVRNEKLEVDFRVVRSSGKYSQEVLGFIEHSEKPRVRKMRPERD